jgi:hypothetical protein
MDDYAMSAKKATEASAAAHQRDISSLHDLAASHHRIAAEHAKQMGDDAKAKEHYNMANMHASAAYSASAKSHPDTAKGGEELTGKDIHLGAMAKADFKAGKNPPSWVTDEDKWDKAKTAASKTYDMDDDAFWPVVTTVYQNMGGSVKHEAKARLAAKRLGAISARRMAGNSALEASVKGNGYSLTDLQCEVAEACEDLDVFESDNDFSGCPWVADIIAPEHEAGETWEAIVSAPGSNDLYCVKFKITSDHEVEVVGEPEEVEHTTDYEYVGAMETEAKDASDKAGLEAADFRGNQHQSASDIADEHSAAARVATRAANKASREAKDAGTHKVAAAVHDAAKIAHTSAEIKHMAAGNDDDADAHKQQAAKHAARAKEHADAIDRLGADAKNAKGEKGLEARSVDCAIQGANAMRTGVPTVDGVMMYMPSGTHQITPSQDGEPVEVTVLVDEAAARKLEAQRAALDKAGKKPFFSIQHETEIAAAWPSRFFWDKRIDATGSLVEGIFVEVEWTKSGREAVEGKDFRTFSPTFFVDAVRNDPEKPARIVCNENARANMGALENDPAFQSISPLWARNAGAPGTTNQNGENENMKETVAELQARQTKLEQTIASLKGKTDDLSKAKLESATFEQREIEAKIEKAKTDEKMVAMEARETERKEQDAEAAVNRMVSIGKIKPRETEIMASYKEKFTNDPTLIKLLAPLDAKAEDNDSEVNGKSITAGNGKDRGGYNIARGDDIAGALKEYNRLMVENAAIDVNGIDGRVEAYRAKGRLAIQAAAVFKNDLAGEKQACRWEHLTGTELGKAAGIEIKARRNTSSYALMAADNTDANLGILSGTLVLQRTLPNFKYEYPELLNFFTDFGDTPGLLGQTEVTRIVVQPAVQKYDTTTDATGRPKGWSTVSAAKTIDAPITLTDYVAVPIVFGNNVLASTQRRLFDEQSVLAIAAIAGYFTALTTDLFTMAKYNAYVGPITQQVPVLYPTYQKDIGGWSMTDLDLLDAAFTSNKVPEKERGIMLNPTYYAKLRGDPRLEFFYAASSASLSGASDFLTEARLPKLSGFAPYKAPYLPAGTPVAAPVTNNVVGFAFQKAGVILKARLPQDFTQVMGNVMIPGSVTTVTDPDTKISLMLVQYVNLQSNYAEWRPEVMLGVGVGDNRAGLVLTSA